MVLVHFSEWHVRLIAGNWLVEILIYWVGVHFTYFVFKILKFCLTTEKKIIQNAWLNLFKKKKNANFLNEIKSAKLKQNIRKTCDINTYQHPVKPLSISVISWPQLNINKIFREIIKKVVTSDIRTVGVRIIRLDVS